MFGLFNQKNKKYNILILGSDGMLGYDVYDFFKKMSVIEGSQIGNVTGIDIKEQVALDTKFGLKYFFEEHPLHYDFCINCVAYTNTSKAENYKDGYDQSYRLNVLAPRYIAEACASFKTKLIHISTDYVFSQFSGHQGRFLEKPFSNNGNEFPCNMYGLHKLLGEKYIETTFLENKSKDYMILRTSWLYGNHNNKSFIHKFLKNVYQTIKDNKTEVEMTENEVSIPTSTMCVTYYISRIIRNFKYYSDFDVHHLNAVPSSENGEGVSRVEFAREILKDLGTYDNIKFNSIEVKPVLRDTYQPTYSALQNTFSDTPDWKTYLHTFLTSFRYDIILWLKEQN